jgi:hypothetical protein
MPLKIGLFLIKTVVEKNSFSGVKAVVTSEKKSTFTEIY